MDRERRTGRMGFEVIRQSFMSAKRVGSEEATLRIHDFGDKNAVGVAGTSSTVPLQWYFSKVQFSEELSTTTWAEVYYRIRRIQMKSPTNGIRSRHQPRRWQREALAAWSVRLRGVVRVVTGAGKTFFAMQCMLAVWRRYPDAKVLIVVPTVALMDQWRVALRNELSLEDDDIDLIGGGDTSN